METPFLRLSLHQNVCAKERDENTPQFDLANGAAMFYTSRRSKSLARWRNWQTRATQTRVPSGVRVRVPPSLQDKKTTREGRFLFTFLCAAILAMPHTFHQRVQYRVRDSQR